MEGFLDVENLYDADPRLARHFEQALSAHVVYKRDRDYIVYPTANPHTGRTEPSIVIVDSSPVAMMAGRVERRPAPGVEAKEGAAASSARSADRRDDHDPELLQDSTSRLAGMTGTADTEAAGIPRHLPPGVVADPHQPGARHATGLRRPHVPHEQREVERDHRRDRQTFHDAGRPSSSAPSASRSARCWRRCSSRQARHQARDPQRQAAREARPT